MHPQSAKKNSKEIFAIHGGGNIGLGLMADVASKSSFKYKIVATSNDKFLKKIVNSANQLWLQHSSVASKLTHIPNVTIISRKFDNVVNLYKDASILAICLTPGAMKDSVKAVAQGLIERYRTHQKELKILVLMNLPNCAEFVRKMVKEEINTLLKYSAEAKKICQSVKFIPTVVDRIVTKIPEQDIKDQLKRHLLNCWSIDFVDATWLNHQVNSMLEQPEKLAMAVNELNLKIRLFNAEKSFALYAPSEIEELSHFPAIKSVNNLQQLDAIKNKYINGPHAIIAWLGGLLGCKTIAKAINYPGMKQFIENTMDQEIATALIAEYPDLTHDELLFFKKLFFTRCEESVDDPVLRVARDPLRKINAGERLRGTLEIQQHHNLNILPSGLALGIAAAILYAVKKIDPSNPDCKKICEIYQKNKSYEDVLRYEGAFSSGHFKGLNGSGDTEWVTAILKNIAALERLYEVHKKDKRPLSLVSNNELSITQVMETLPIKKNDDTLEKTIVPISSLFISKIKLGKNFMKSLFFSNPNKLSTAETSSEPQAQNYNYGNR